MDKSVYSIVLADDVVEAIDAMAYQMNTSRSNLINQILAERVSLMTPEMRMKEIFSAIEKLMEPRFQLLDQPSDAMLSLKSPLKYKYKPTIRYSVELSRSFSGKVGSLKIQFRTQSAQLINSIESFFEMWQEIENKYLANAFKNGVPSTAAEGRYVRDFYSPNARKLTDGQIGNAIGEYIRLADRCIQIYFDGLSQGKDSSSEIEKIYRDYLNKGIIIL
jgi:hypothetical protein